MYPAVAVRVLRIVCVPCGHRVGFAEFDAGNWWKSDIKLCKTEGVGCGEAGRGYAERGYAERGRGQGCCHVSGVHALQVPCTFCRV